MAIPSYAYLKLMIHGPTGVITVETKMKRALDYEQDIVELAAIVLTMVKLRELSLRIPTMPLSLAIPPMSDVFKTDEDGRAIQIDVVNPTKTMKIGASFDPKEESELIDIL
jgi:hypothetical protein